MTLLANVLTGGAFEFDGVVKTPRGYDYFALTREDDMSGYVPNSGFTAPVLVSLGLDGVLKASSPSLLEMLTDDGARVERSFTPVFWPSWVSMQEVEAGLQYYGDDMHEWVFRADPNYYARAIAAESTGINLVFRKYEPSKQMTVKDLHALAAGKWVKLEVLGRKPEALGVDSLSVRMRVSKNGDIRRKDAEQLLVMADALSERGIIKDKS
jgi:hypothetical protein